MTVIYWIVAAVAIIYLVAQFVPQGISHGEFRGDQAPHGTQTSARG